MKAIVTKLLPATATRPTRIKARDEDGNRVTYTPPGFTLNVDGDHHHDAAKKLCKKMGWTGELVRGSIGPGQWAFCFYQPKGLTAILDILVAERDRAGNPYFAFRWTQTRSTKQVTGKISGGQSNILAAASLVTRGNYSGGTYYWTEHTYGFRQWSHHTAEFPYAGCAPQEIAKFILAEIAKQEATT